MSEKDSASKNKVITLFRGAFHLEFSKYGKVPGTKSTILNQYGNPFLRHTFLMPFHFSDFSSFVCCVFMCLTPFLPRSEIIYSNISVRIFQMQTSKYSYSDSSKQYIVKGASKVAKYYIQSCFELQQRKFFKMLLFSK